MNGKPRIHKKLFTFASRRRKRMNPVSRWQIILIALMLALALGSAGLPPQVQAAPAGETVRFYMDVVNPRTTLCTGERVTYTVRVYRQSTSAPPGWTDKNLPDPIEIAGVWVNAYPPHPKSIGTFTGADKAGFVGQQTGFNSDVPYNVEFEFTAGKKPGDGVLYFDGAVKGFKIQTGYVSFTVPVKVKKCPIKAELILHGGISGLVAWTGAADEIILNADSDTHFSGTADYQFAEQFLFQSDDCSVTGTVTTSPVDYSADLVGDTLNLTITIQYKVSSVTAICPEDVGSGSFSLPTATPMSLSLPSQGGVGSISNTYAEYLVIVERVIDEAAAWQWETDQTAWLPWLNGDPLTLHP